MTTPTPAPSPSAEQPKWDLEVTDATLVTPHFRRLELTAADLRAFAPEPGQDLMFVVPRPGLVGTINRRYTIRHFDRSRDRILVDAALHGDGPGNRWMGAATPGDRIDAVGPRGKVTPDLEADCHVFVADDTGVPATLAMIESLPAGCRVIALLEIDDSADEQGWLVEPQADVDLIWVYRGAQPCGHPDLLVAALAEVKLPTGSGHVYLSAEAGVVRSLRGQLTERGWALEHLSPKAYWVVGKPNAPHGEPGRDDQ